MSDMDLFDDALESGEAPMSPVIPLPGSREGVDVTPIRRTHRSTKRSQRQRYVKHPSQAVTVAGEQYGRRVR